MQAYRILIVSKSDGPYQILSKALPKDRYSLVHVCQVDQAKRILIKRMIDLIILDMPLKEDSGLRFAQSIAQDPSMALLLLMNAKLYHLLAAKMQDYGVCVLAKPVSYQSLCHSVSILCTMQTRIRKFEKEKLDLQAKMKEIQLVNQAKWILIKQKGFSEDQAHQYILKQAMDTCTTKHEIATQIIHMYQNKGGRS